MFFNQPLVKSSTKLDVHFLLASYIFRYTEIVFFFSSFLISLLQCLEPHRTCIFCCVSCNIWHYLGLVFSKFFDQHLAICRTSEDLYFFKFFISHQQYVALHRTCKFFLIHFQLATCNIWLNRACNPQKWFWISLLHYLLNYKHLAIFVKFHQTLVGLQPD